MSLHHRRPLYTPPAAVAPGGAYGDYFPVSDAGNPIVSRGALQNPSYSSDAFGWSWGQAAGSTIADTQLMATNENPNTLGTQVQQGTGGGFWYRDDVAYADIPDNNVWVEVTLSLENGVWPFAFGSGNAMDPLICGNETASAGSGYGVRYDDVGGERIVCYTYRFNTPDQGSRDFGLLPVARVYGGVIRLQCYNNGGNPIIALWSDYPDKGTPTDTAPTGNQQYTKYSEQYTSGMLMNFGTNKRAGIQQFGFGRNSYYNWRSGPGDEFPS